MKWTKKHKVENKCHKIGEKKYVRQYAFLPTHIYPNYISERDYDYVWLERYYLVYEWQNNTWDNGQSWFWVGYLSKSFYSLVRFVPFDLIKINTKPSLDFIKKYILNLNL